MIDYFKQNTRRNHMKKKSTHGGYREGSGRKKKEPTKVIRVPEDKAKALKEIAKDKEFWDNLDIRFRNL